MFVKDCIEQIISIAFNKESIIQYSTNNIDSKIYCKTDKSVLSMALFHGADGAASHIYKGNPRKSITC